VKVVAEVLKSKSEKSISLLVVIVGKDADIPAATTEKAEWFMVNKDCSFMGYLFECYLPKYRHLIPTCLKKAIL